MYTANIHEVKTFLSKLLKRVQAGETILIAKAGKPVAKIVPLDSTERQPGYWKDQITIADDFDELPKDVLEEFYKPNL